MMDSIKQMEGFAMLFGRSTVQWALCTLVLASVALLGCPETGVLKDGLVIVDDVPELNVAAVEEDAVSFTTSGDSPIQVGDIIVGSDKGGFLRRVEAVSEGKGGVLTQTSKASLAEAIDVGMLFQDIEFTTQDFIDAGLIGPDGTATLIDLSGKDIYRDYGIAISVSRGTLECVPEIYLAATWDNFNLSTFNMQTSGIATLNFDVEVAVDDQTQLRFETDLIPPITHPFATSIGPIPVVGVASLRFPIGVVGRFDGDTGVTAGFDVVDDFDIGARLENGAWDGQFEMGTPVLTGHEPVWVIEVGADIMVYVKVVPAGSLYDAATLSGYVMPYLNADINVYPSPMTFVLTGGLNAGVSFDLSIFDFRVFGYSYDWTGPSAVLYSYTNAY